MKAEDGQIFVEDQRGVVDSANLLNGSSPEINHSLESIDEIANDIGTIGTDDNTRRQSENMRIVLKADRLEEH